MILALIEHDRGALNELSLEMLTLARNLANEQNLPLEAILIGKSGHGLAGQLPRYGVTRIHLVQHGQLDDYAPEAWAQGVIHLIEAESPQAALVAGTERGNEVMAHVAAKTSLPLATNCIKVQPGDPYLVTRLRWGGSLLEEARLHGKPALLTVAPHTIVAKESPVAGAPVLNTVTPTLTEKDFRVQVVERVETTGDQVTLVDARVVVGGGRGVGSSKGFESLDELATLLDGAVGCSRAVTNEGWRPHADQVGQTGTRIAPDLYIACGISGAIQHMVGCKGARHMLVVNTDPEAPIISKADYAVIGDLHEIIPAIVETLYLEEGR